MLIGNMELADSVSSNGFIIYTPDGYKAKKMTVDRLAKAIEAYMRNDSNAGEGRGGGLQYWKEFRDFRNNSFLYTENPSEEFTTISQMNLGISRLTRDCWTSKYQYDSYDSANKIPNFEGCIEFKSYTDDEEAFYDENHGQFEKYFYYPYSVYALIHKNGSVLEDYILVDESEGLYKIAKTDYDRYSVYIFILGGNDANGTTILPDILPDVDPVPSSFIKLPDEGTEAEAFRIYKLQGTYSSYDDCANALSSAFLPSGNTVEIAGYFKYGDYIENIANFLNRDTHEDDDQYIYINSSPSMINVWKYSTDDQTYIDKEDLASLLLDILEIELKPTYSAISNIGIFLDFPFTREESNPVQYQLAYEAAKAKYSDEVIMIKDANFNDAIFLGDGEEYSTFLTDYISSHLSDLSFIANVRLGDFSIVDSNNVAQLNVGRGLTVQMQNGKPTIVVNSSELQPTLTPGEGVSINNNVISATGSIEEIYVDGVSAIDPETKIAEIWLPTGLKETRLNNGDHIEIETVTQGTNYDIYKINAVDIKNNVIENSDSHSFLNNADSESAVIASITVPADAKGIIVANLYFDSGTNTNDGIVSALVSDNGSWPLNDQALYMSPMYDSKPINKPYQIAGIDHNALTNLKIFGRYSNTFSTPLTVYLLAKKDVNSAVTVQGEITFTQDIDI